MKPFVIWLCGSLLAVAGLGGAYHLALSDSPRRVAVVVDSAYPMTDAWSRVPSILRRIEDRRYSVFSLSTEKGGVHGWQSRLTLGPFRPYGPRKLDDIDALAQRPEIAEAGEVYFITNAPEAVLAGLSGWEVVRP